MSELKRLPLSSVVVDGRHRKDLGDLDGLAKSIETVGLLHPIVVRPDYTLVAGLRRLRAVEKLGWDHVPAHVVKGLDEALPLLQAEAQENTCRKDLTPEEAVSLGRMLEEPERAKAKARERAGKSPDGQAGGRGKKKPPGKFPEGFTGETRDKVGEAVGMSGRTYEKAKAVIAAAEQDPQTFGPIADKMNQTGSVNKAHRRLVNRKKVKELEAKAAAVPKSSAGTWEIRHGDCLKVLAGLDEGCARLVFADPPYNIGVDYGEGVKADRLPEAEYVSWCQQWVDACVRVLSPDGSLWVLISDEYADHMGIVLRKSGLYRRAWIKWFETFGTYRNNNFGRCSRHLFYCVKDQKNFVFHPSAVNCVSARIKIEDARGDPDGKIWVDVWGVDPPIERIPGTSRERIPGFPTQLPVALLTPVVCCASDPGDLVIDSFSSSATTGLVCIEQGRRFLGIEKQKEFVRLSRQRLLAASATPAPAG
jgi:DNA modification methylase